MKEPIRILHCLPGNLGCGGIEVFIMNLYRNINRNKIQFDFIVHGYRENYYEDEIKKLGGNIYRVPFIKEYSKYKKSMKEIIQSEKYDVIHIHGMYANVYFDAKMAKKFGIKKIIIHSHTYNNEDIKKRVFNKLIKRKITNIANFRFGCSKKAVEWMFNKNKKYHIINNTIDTKTFKYNEETREKIRKQLNIQNEFVIGHVGRIVPVKNHEFLIKVFKEIQQIEKNSKLIIVGDGEKKETIENEAKKLGINESVLFLGTRDDTYNILQAMDVFVFPSKYEGLGIAVIEAQASGLKCFVSDSVSEEVKITKLVKFISLYEEPKKWADIIIKNKIYKREDTSEAIKKKNYDIYFLTKKFEILYTYLGRK